MKGGTVESKFLSPVGRNLSEEEKKGQEEGNVRITGITLRLQAKSNSDEGKMKLKDDSSERKQTPQHHISKA